MYRKMYLVLFRAMTRALEALEQRDVSRARFLLMTAQNEAESIWLDEGENGSDEDAGEDGIREAEAFPEEHPDCPHRGWGRIVPFR